jgi:hypothetical protein
MVIFLATISFIPAKQSSDNNRKNVSVSQHEYFKSFTQTYSAYSYPQILLDISKFQAAESLPLDTPVEFARFIGGYNSTTESPNQGNLAALVFSQKLTSANSAIFNKMQSNIDSSTKVPSGNVTIILTFGSNSNN